MLSLLSQYNQIFYILILINETTKKSFQKLIRIRENLLYLVKIIIWCCTEIYRYLFNGFGAYLVLYMNDESQ